VFSEWNGMEWLQYVSEVKQASIRGFAFIQLLARCEPTRSEASCRESPNEKHARDGTEGRRSKHFCMRLLRKAIR